MLFRKSDQAYAGFQANPDRMDLLGKSTEGSLFSDWPLEAHSVDLGQRARRNEIVI